MGNEMSEKQVSVSDIKMYVGLVLGSLFLIAFGWFLVWAVMDHQDYLENEQKKQDKCIAAGGAWIDNRNTDAYCYFNK